jgi:hypothetical protein
MYHTSLRAARKMHSLRHHGDGSSIAMHWREEVAFLVRV